MNGTPRLVVQHPVGPVQGVRCPDGPLGSPMDQRGHPGVLVVASSGEKRPRKRSEAQRGEEHAVLGGWFATLMEQEILDILGFGLRNKVL